MSKTKMRCNTCGKWFQSANAKDLTCPDCMQKARKEKMAAKTAPPTTRQPGQTNLGTGTPSRSVPPPPKPKPAAGGTSHWLDAQNDVKVGQPDQLPSRPKLPPSPAARDNRGAPERGGDRGPGTYRDERSSGPGGYREGGYRGPGGYRENDYRSPNSYRENDYRSPTPYRVGGGMGLPDTISPRPRQPMPGGPNRERGPRPGGPGELHQRPGGKPAGQKKISKPKPETPPKPKREKIPPPTPFKPTEEQIAQVEARYQELAVPTEYDGIRTQISKELNIPKTAVKKIIKDFREKEHIPSWWELQTYKGDSEELERIKAVYEPFLPVPPVGVHKQIAEQLSLQPSVVYQAIKAIRQEMNLPQYNDPALHAEELAAIRAANAKRKAESAAASETSNKQEAEAAAVNETSDTREPEPVSISEISAEHEPAPTSTNEVNAEHESAPASTDEASVKHESAPALTDEVSDKHEPEPTSAAETSDKQAETPASAETSPNPAVEEIGPHGEITSIETDTIFHKEGDTIEIGTSSATDTPAIGEA